MRRSGGMGGGQDFLFSRFDPCQKMSRLERAFWRFHHNNPHVYAIFSRLCRQVRARGFAHYSVDAIWQRMRWHFTIETSDPDFKLNDHHRAYYARYYLEQHPEAGDFFELRQLRAS
jgi:hypothetical protein